MFISHIFAPHTSRLINSQRHRSIQPFTTHQHSPAFALLSHQRRSAMQLLVLCFLFCLILFYSRTRKSTVYVNKTTRNAFHNIISILHRWWSCLNSKRKIHSTASVTDSHTLMLMELEMELELLWMMAKKKLPKRYKHALLVLSFQIPIKIETVFFLCIYFRFCFKLKEGTAT